MKKNDNIKYDTIPEEQVTASNKTNKDIPEIDRILEKQGYSIHTLKYILIVFLIISLEGLHMTMFQLMIIPLTNYFQMSDFQIKFVSGILFVGVGAGSFSSGVVTSKYDRSYVINLFLSIIFISNVLIGVTKSFGIFIILRLIIGYSLGLIVPACLNLLAECLPIKNRAFVLTCVWCSFQIGQLYLLTIMLAFMPNFEIEQVQLVILLSSFLALGTMFTSIGFLEDSPRMLILKGKHEEGFRILEQWNGDKLCNSNKNKIIAELSHDPSVEQTKDITLLFKKKMGKLTILLTMVWFFDSVMSYGTGVVTVLTMKSLGVEHSMTNREIIINQMIMTLIAFPSNILGGYLSELSFLGRNKTTNVGFFFAVIFVGLAILFPAYFTLFIGLFFAFTSIAFNVNTTYSCEVYPTKIRDVAMGFLFFSTRVGGFLSQFFYLSMSNINKWLPYYFTILVVLINMIFVYMMPYETYGKPLDIDLDSEEKEVKTKC
jgi:AAHS family 4-hydroxybenzoate transporter-like MFS transporter